jgi:ammonia channel protein AmtB
LPILAYEGDNSNAISRFNLYTGPICIILAMGSAVVTSISCFSFKYGVEKGLRVKDILNGIIAGGVVCGSASFYITTPVLALICGATAAICQFIFEHFL